MHLTKMKTPTPLPNKPMTSSSHTLLPALALALVCGAQSASAVLTWDLRAATVNGVANSGGAKSVTVPGGAVDVTFELWAVVTGADAVTNETLTSGQGTIMSSPGVYTPGGVTVDPAVSGNAALAQVLNPGGVLRGDLSNLMVTPWLTATTAKNGTSTDLDGDGDLDVGTTTNGASVNYFQANAGGAQSTGNAGDFNTIPGAGGGREWKISIVTFHIANALAGQTTGVNFVVPLFTAALTNNARASFVTDGTTRTGVSANLAVAAPVVLTVVPEPTAFGMVLLGSLGLVGFRRLGLRKA